MQDYKKLKVWEKAHQLTLKIYKLSSSFPKEEMYGIVSQIRRASYSIPSNIAEGCGKRTAADTSRFMQIALGSANELEYFLILSKDLRYYNENEYDTLYDNVNEIKAMLLSLIPKITNYKNI